MYKTLSFAVMHFAIAFTVAYLITGSLVVGGAVAVIEPAVNTIAYYFHEKLWQDIDLRSSLASYFETISLRVS